MLGPNGIGKTTLLKCLAGLDEPAAGKVLLESRDISELPRQIAGLHIGMLQQHTVYVFDSAACLQTALTGRHPHLGYWEREGAADFEKAREALQAVGPGRICSSAASPGCPAARPAALLSPRCLVQEPEIMLLDEPTNHLDLKHQVEIMRMIEERTESGSSSAFAALHDINLAARYCSTCLDAVRRRRLVRRPNCRHVDRNQPGKTVRLPGRAYRERYRAAVSSGADRPARIFW